MNWEVSYIIGKFLELKCLKWAHMTHLDTSNTSYGQKKGQESNWQFDFRPLKVKNRPDSLCSGDMPHTIENLSMKATTLFSTSFQSEVCTQSYGPPKLHEFQLWELQDLRVPRQNDIWVLVMWPSTKYNIRGKVVASSKFGSWWVLWIRVCPWLNRAPKCSNYELTNSLFGLCRSMWVIELIINLLSPHPGASTHPFTHEVLWAN